ncbi:hypothetical protein [Flavobacterium sp.]|uniref:hypothetical protein n=1 Tax=Flavobacterium sp. TaxID=239 RepID=UPI0026335EAB|nr:hypothetical protein [Flavobacterium sp.]
MTLNEIENYFINRSNELIALSLRWDPWSFLCGSAMIDYLTHMVYGDSNRKLYVKFVEEYLSQVNSLYKNFKYLSGDQDLPTQMYVILRCGIVHSFSFVPDSIGIKNGGRKRSILLAHEMGGGVHFSRSKSGLDAVVFTAETFALDIQQVINIIFQQAKIDSVLENEILSYVSQHPPIMGTFT